MDIDVGQITPMKDAAVGEGVLSARYRAATIGMIALVSLGAFEALAVATAMPAVAAALDGGLLSVCCARSRRGWPAYCRNTGIARHCRSAQQTTRSLARV